MHVRFGARDEKRHVCLKTEEPGEIDIASIHDVEGTGFDREMIECFDIVHFSIGNVDKAGDVAAKVDQGMELDGSFASAEVRPREEGQTKIDGGGIESVDGLIQGDGETLSSIEFASVCNEDVREIGIDAPVAILIGYGQCVASDRAANSQVIEFGLDRIQTRFDIAETVTVGQLSKRHAEELIEAGEMSGTIISSVLEDAAVEIALGQGVHELSEEIGPGVHRQAPSTVFRGEVYGIPRREVEIDAAENGS